MLTCNVYPYNYCTVLFIIFFFFNYSKFKNLLLSFKSYFKITSHLDTYKLVSREYLLWFSSKNCTPSCLKILSFIWYRNTFYPKSISPTFVWCHQDTNNTQYDLEDLLLLLKKYWTKEGIYDYVQWQKWEWFKVFYDETWEINKALVTIF